MYILMFLDSLITDNFPMLISTSVSYTHLTLPTT